jgi:phage-related protein
VITFITGVFTGNWKQAWNGIVQIFSGIWNGIVGIVKGVINSIIDAVNGVIGGINGVAGAVKDATGGAVNFTIGKIPRLENGGIVQAVPGGIMANIGEGRYNEAVIPLSPRNLDALSGQSAASGSDRPWMNVEKIVVQDQDPIVAARIFGVKTPEVTLQT